MAVTDQQVKDYLIANPGLSDYAIAQKMDEFGVNPAQMASATGSKLEDIQGRYTQAKDIGGYFAAPENQGLDDTAYARKINDSKWTADDVSRVTGAALPDVTSRLNTATKFNTLTDSNAALTTGLETANKSLTGLQTQTKGYQDQIGLLNTKYGTLNTSYLDLQKQLAALKAKSTSTPTTPGLTTGTGVVTTGGSNTTPINTGASSTGMVYGPDGTAYPGPAAAIAAGVYNYTMFPPTGPGQPKGVVESVLNPDTTKKLSGATGNYYGGVNTNPDNPWVNLYPTKA